MRGRRERGQTFVVAALAMTAMLGALSMVIDAGVFFVIQHQLQNAADAAALAAVWYDPACPAANMGNDGCQNTNPNGAAPECPPPGQLPCTAAIESVKANWSSVLGLCAGPNLAADPLRVHVSAYPGLPPAGNLNVPQVTPYVVSVSCDAPHWFARALPGVNLTVKLQANAAAALGWLLPNGQIDGTKPATPTRLVARLIL